MACRFIEMLDKKQAEGKLVCVGLDSEALRIPDHLWGACGYKNPEPVVTFNQEIIRATADTICAYKPNVAFYEERKQGPDDLRKTVEMIKKDYPDIPVIIDGKDGDIGDTNKAYVRARFDHRLKKDEDISTSVYAHEPNLNADAITINPYLGEEANKPFLERDDKGIIVLCKTSNKGGGEFQDLLTYLSYEELAELTDDVPLPKGFEDQWTAHIVSYQGKGGYLIPLYQMVALRVSRRWNRHGNCMLVVGATYPEQLGWVRKIVGDNMYILVPGIGKQGGDLEATLKHGLNSRGTGLIINSSSGTIFASLGHDYAEAARQETLKLHEAIGRLRQGGES